MTIHVEEYRSWYMLHQSSMRQKKYILILWIWRLSCIRIISGRKKKSRNSGCAALSVQDYPTPWAMMCLRKAFDSNAAGQVSRLPNPHSPQASRQLHALMRRKGKRREDESVCLRGSRFNHSSHIYKCLIIRPCAHTQTHMNTHTCNNTLLWFSLRAEHSAMIYKIVETVHDSQRKFLL